jgi:hypothetical protein
MGWIDGWVNGREMVCYEEGGSKRKRGLHSCIRKCICILSSEAVDSRRERKAGEGYLDIPRKEERRMNG